MSVIITADLHFDDNPRNSDRWNLFPWLRKQAQKYKVSHILILGDVTDSKNRHDAALVNKLVDNIFELSLYAKVIILVGNHDFIDEKSPFFAFLSKLTTNVIFIRKPKTIELDIGLSLFLPCTRNYREEWKDLDFERYDLIFTHQSYDGCISENGTKLKGIPPSYFASFKGKVYSGDVHVAQKVSKNIEYVGAPYRIHFGDQYTPRTILHTSGKPIDLHFKGRPRELLDCKTLEEVREASFEIGAQVKIRYHLRRRDYPEWPKIKKEIKALAERRGWETCGLQLKTIQVKSREKDTLVCTTHETKPSEVLKEFAERKKLSKELSNRGRTLIKEAAQ